MSQNLFKGFKRFVEEVPPRPGQEDPHSFTHTVKHQLPINFRAFASQPILIPAGKPFGKYEKPINITLIVKQMDDSTVTLVESPPEGIRFPSRINPDNNVWDADREMSIRQDRPTSGEEYILTREEFEKLLEPGPAPKQPGM